MPSTQINFDDEAISYAYEIEKTVEVHLTSNRTFRLEVVHCVKGTAQAHYDVRYYERQSLHKGPDGSISIRSVPNSVEFYVWVVDRDLPWINQPTRDAALNQALSWLTERRNNSNLNW